MNNCKILLIDTPSDIKLLNESTSHMKLPVKILTMTSVSAALEIVEKESPDIIMIGSGIVILEGVECLLKLGTIPIVILCEADGFNRIYKDRSCNVCLITRPLDIKLIPDMISKALEFMFSCREDR